MKFRLPEITKKENSAVITCWHVKEKEHVRADQDIVEVSTDKATFDIAAPCNGILNKIIKKEGEDARIGEIIAEIE